MSIVIENVMIVTQNADREIKKGSILVEDGRIKEISEKTLSGDTVISGKYAAVPGFVNLHAHVAMSLLRGMVDDVSLDKFLEGTFKVDAQRTREDIYAGAMLGMVEMLGSGITTFVDFYYGEDIIAEAAEALGMRAHLAWCVLDEKFTTQKGSPLKNAENFIMKYRTSKFVKPGVAVQGVYVADEDTWLKAKEISEKYGTICTYHLAETKREVYEFMNARHLRPCEFLDKIGFLGEHQIAVHCCYLKRNEIKALARNRVSVGHCPVSNMKLASGIAPVPEMLDAGINVGLGTDSNASNNALNFLREVHVAGLLHKLFLENASAMTAQQLLDMMTINGARAIGMEKEIGSIEVGKKADIVLFNLSAPCLVPTTEKNIVSNIVYSANPAAIDYVLVNGEIKVEHGRFNRSSEIAEMAENAAKKFL